MKRSIFNLLAVAAVVLAPAAAEAAVNRAHEPHRMASHYQSVRGAYGMYEPRGIEVRPQLSDSPPPVWGGRNAAVDGNNANSMSGSDSGPENPTGEG